MSDATNTSTRTPTGTPRWVVVTIAVSAVLVLAVALLGRNVVRLRIAAEEARTALDAGLSALREGDLERARSSLDEVHRHVDVAARASSGPTWWVGERLPVLSRSLETARIAVEVAGTATEVADHLVDQVDGLTGADGITTVRREDGGLDIARVQRAADGLDAIDVDGLRSALARLAATSPDVPAVVREARDEVLAEAGRLLDFTDDATALADIMPDFLGASGRREYLVAMQNLGELRGTGGLIGFFATLTVEDGRFALTSPERYDVLDVTELAPEAAAIEGVDPGFLDRYERNQVTTFLGNTNLDPDLPTVGRVLLDLYERERGRRLDGVLVLDPIGLTLVHAPVGPIELPPELVPPGVPSTIPNGDLPRLLMVDVYDELGGDSQVRKYYLAQVAVHTFSDIASGQWPMVPMITRLSAAAGRKHLQVYSAHPDEQAVFEEMGVAGALPVPADADLFAITASNVAGNKSDVHVAHRIRASIDLSAVDGQPAVLQRDVDVEVTVANPLSTTGHDIYIIGSSERGEGFVEAFTGPLGLNRTWFTAWTPPGSTAHRIQNANGRLREDVDVDEVRGLRALDYVLETPAESARTFGLGWSGTTPVSVLEDGTVEYRLRLHRQAKAIPDRLSLAITLPHGWTADAAVVSVAGDQDWLFGADGEPGPLVTAAIEAGGVTVSGDLTRDAEVVLRLVPARG